MIWTKNNLDMNITLSTVDILFGIPFEKKNHVFLYLNYIILIAKWYVYRCSFYDDRLFLMTFLLELKSSVYIEYYIESLKLNDTPNKWELFLFAV